jgi:large subunit ribosomal protein L31
VKKGIHPTYRPVVFRDIGGDFAMLTRSTVTSEATIEWADGRTYPVVDVDVSSASHPFYTGRTRVLDTAGRVEKFRRRYGSPGSTRPAPPTGQEETR